MIPLYNTDGSSTCPLGMAMCQNRLAVPTWSYAMEVLPPARVIELGSYNGAFATALGVHAHMIGADVITYDLMAPDERIAPLAAKLGVTFRKADIWASTGEISALIARPGTTFMLCDGGDKLRELETFSRALKAGDVIAVHDYDAAHECDPSIPSLERAWPWSEVRKAQGDSIAAVKGLSPWMQEYFDDAGWLAYRKLAA